MSNYQDPVVGAALEGYKLACSILQTVCMATNDKSCKEVVSSTLSRARQARQYLASYGLARFLTFYAAKASKAFSNFGADTLYPFMTRLAKALTSTCNNREYNRIMIGCVLNQLYLGLKGGKVDETEWGYLIYLIALLRAYYYYKSTLGLPSDDYENVEHVIDIITTMISEYARGSMKVKSKVWDYLLDILSRMFEIALTPLEDSYCVIHDVEQLCGGE